MEAPGPSKRAKQKRNRIITACYDCRERKAGCDRLKPICSRCRNCRTCVYLDPPNSALVNGVSRKVSSLPADIKKKVIQLYSQCSGDGRETEDDGEDEDGELEINPLILDSASYEDDAAIDEALDLGFRIGKIQLADRVGGQHRPGMVLELKALLQSTAQQPEWLEEQRLRPVPPSIFTQGCTSPNESFMKPSKSYLAPRVSLLSLKLPFNVTEYLPPSAYCDRILAHYWDAVHPVARILHRPSFEKRWHIFFDDLQHHRKPVRSLVAIVFAVLFAGIAAMRPAQPIQFENRDQHDWLRRIQSGTELALEQAQMIQTAKVETMQAFTAYLMVLCRAEISRVHSALVAAAVRVAECNGLHCDGSERGYSIVETHVRRLIWYNLCFLDIRVSEAQGPRPIIRSEDFTTKYPANVNDADLTRPGAISNGDTSFLETTCTIVRFRCQEFIRWIWTARKQLDRKEISVTSVLNKIEAFRLEWSLKFERPENEQSLQQYAMDMLDLMTLRTFAMVLSPYYMHPTFQMPDRLISILIDRGIQTMERVIEMETAAKYHLWHWYSGALHQNHYALLMSTIILCRPRHKESVRMWRGLEYVFEPPPLPPIARARWIVTHSCLRMDHYLTKRRLRTPAEFHDHLNEVLWLSEQHSPSSTELRSRASIRRPPLHRDPPSSTSQRQSTSSDFRRPSLEPRSSSDASFQAYQETASRKPPAQNKQILHVDWADLAKYYPPGTFSGDMDLPFDAWTQRMQSVQSTKLYPAEYAPSSLLAYQTIAHPNVHPDAQHSVYHVQTTFGDSPQDSAWQSHPISAPAHTGYLETPTWSDGVVDSASSPQAGLSWPPPYAPAPTVIGVQSSADLLPMYRSDASSPNALYETQSTSN